MVKCKIGSGGLEIPRLGLGCVTFGREIDERQSFRVLDYAFERGINLLDTAEAYGEMHASEKIVGRWLRRTGLRGQVVLTHEDASGHVIDATALQHTAALDDRYAAAADERDLGLRAERRSTYFKLWAPTALGVAVCVYPDGNAAASALVTMRLDARSGIWSATRNAHLAGGYYTYLVDVYAPPVGLVRYACASTSGES